MTPDAQDVRGALHDGPVASRLLRVGRGGAMEPQVESVPLETCGPHLVEEAGPGQDTAAPSRSWCPSAGRCSLSCGFPNPQHVRPSVSTSGLLCFRHIRVPPTTSGPHPPWRLVGIAAGGLSGDLAEWLLTEVPCLTGRRFLLIQGAGPAQAPPLSPSSHQKRGKKVLRGHRGHLLLRPFCPPVPCSSDTLVLYYQFTQF